MWVKNVCYVVNVESYIFLRRFGVRLLRPSWFSPSRQRNVRARNLRKGISAARRPRGHHRLTKRSIRSGFSDIHSKHVKFGLKCAWPTRDIGKYLLFLPYIVHPTRGLYENKTCASGDTGSYEMWRLRSECLWGRWRPRSSTCLDLDAKKHESLSRSS